MKAIILVGTGGFLGSAARYALHLWLPASRSLTFPWPTFMANVAGCFLIGILFAAGELRNWPQHDVRLFLMAGFCGGFTTFSTFALENFRYWQAGQLAGSVLYTLASLLLGFIATAAGYMIIKLLR